MNTFEFDKTNKQKKRSPGEGSRIRDLLVQTLRNPIKTLNWKPNSGIS